MNHVTTSKREKCVICGRVTHEVVETTYCSVTIRAPLCKEHEKQTIFLEPMLKSLCNAISKCVYASQWISVDEQIISDYRKKEATQ